MFGEKFKHDVCMSRSLAVHSSQSYSDDTDEDAAVFCRLIDGQPGRVPNDDDDDTDSDSRSEAGVGYHRRALPRHRSSLLNAFDFACGRNVRLCEDGIRATRTLSFNHGLVFSRLPLTEHHPFTVSAVRRKSCSFPSEESGLVKFLFIVPVPRRQS